jgi:hypothetical protein
MQMQAVAQSFFEVPNRVNHAVEWTENVISHSWNTKRDSQTLWRSANLRRFMVSISTSKRDLFQN